MESTFCTLFSKATLEYDKAFAASLPENVKYAELIAHWEQALTDIENGNGNAANLLTEIEKTANSIITVERGRENLVKVTRNKGLGSCPRCGQPVIENSKGFSCSSGREKCGFFIWGQDKRIGRSYTTAEISGCCQAAKSRKKTVRPQRAISTARSLRLTIQGSM